METLAGAGLQLVAILVAWIARRRFGTAALLVVLFMSVPVFVAGSALAIASPAPAPLKLLGALLFAAAPLVPAPDGPEGTV